jgi:hypothetical protein
LEALIKALKIMWKNKCPLKLYRTAPSLLEKELEDEVADVEEPMLIKNILHRSFSTCGEGDGG